MKVTKPGQLCMINNVLYRARKRVNGCFGCSLNSPMLCPNIVDCRNGVRPLQCDGNNIILVKCGRNN